MKKGKTIYETVSADTKFHSDAPFTCVDVVFKSKEQIEALIGALQKLLTEDTTPDIVQVEDDNSTHDDGLSAALYFHRPGFERDDLDLRCLASASDLIMRYQNVGEEKKEDG